MKNNFIKTISIFLIIFESTKSNLNINIGPFLLILCIGEKFLNKNIEIKKLLKTSFNLYLIYIFFNIVTIVLNYAFKGIIINNNESLKIIKETLLLNGSYQFNILIYIIVLILLTSIFKFIISKNKIIDTLILIILLSLSLINDIFLLTLAYYLGYFFEKYENKYLNFFIIILNIISFIFFKSYLNLLLPILLYVFAKNISKHINNYNINSFISFIDNKNFGIFLIYEIVLSLINLLNFNNTLSNNIGITILTYLLSIIIVTRVSFLPIINTLVKDRI